MVRATVAVRTLREGQRFKLPLSGRKGKVVNVLSTRVKVTYDSQKTETGAWVEQSKGLAPVYVTKMVERSETLDISLNTEVEAL